MSRRAWPALLQLLLPPAVAADEGSLLDGWYDVWFFRFLVNMLGYSTIIIPGYLLISYFKRTNYLETGEENLIVENLSDFITFLSGSFIKPCSCLSRPQAAAPATPL